MPGGMSIMKSAEVPKIQIVTRSGLIDLLREELLKLTSDEGSSVCKAVAERGVFCKGFLRFTDAELRQRYQWIDRKLKRPSRKRLEEVADQWQIARQEVTQLPLACDVQQIEHDACRGWDDFTDAELSRFYRELSGRAVSVKHEAATKAQ